MSTGLDFVSLQVRDLEASATFYEQIVGFRRLAAPNPHAIVFASSGAAFAVRTLVPGTDLDAAPQPGVGVGLWFHDEDCEQTHARLAASDVPIVQEPIEGPFGLTFSFRDLDGYVITLHSKA